jgi:L-aspartate oxidase
MTAGAGVVRTPASLASAGAAVAELAQGWRRSAGLDSDGGDELRNLLTVASALLCSAEARQESRGAHTRADFPATDERWRCRLVHAAPAGRG